MKEREEEEDEDFSKVFSKSYSELHVADNGAVIDDNIGVLSTDSWFLLRRGGVSRPELA